MRHERRWLVPIAAALALLLAAAAPGAAQDGRVLGRVTDGAGNPVARATVALVPGEAGEPRTAVTGPTGGFQFEEVPPGEHVVRVAREGFAPREVRVTVRTGRVTTQVIRLLRARG